MTLTEKLMKEFEQLTEEKKKREQKEIESLMDSVIEENSEALRELAK